MPKIKEWWMKCPNPNCGQRFKPPYFIPTTEAFELFITKGNETRCPACKTMMGCDRSNMSYVTEDGQSGGVGDEYGR